MKKLSKIVLLSTLGILMSACGGNNKGDTNVDPIEVAPDDNKVHIVILTGQSGARGKAKNSDLSEEDAVENLDVDIFSDGLTMPSLSNIPLGATTNELIPVQVGLGDSSSEFGPEIGIAQTLASRYPKNGSTRRSVIVKYAACGSTFTDHWYSKSAYKDEDIQSSLNLSQKREDSEGNIIGPLTYNLYDSISKTIDIIKNEGYEYVIDGVIFSHGEQDAKYDVNMEIYEKSLKYFISDLRDFVKDEGLPFIIAESITNAARYSNKLREIQANVSKEVENTTLVSAKDLYTNTFEPWHYGAKSNLIIGNRCASEIVSHYDYREVKNILFEDSYNLTINGKAQLSTYFPAEFKNGYTGYIKVSYPQSIDVSSTGTKEVKIKYENVYGEFEDSISVVVSDIPVIDGELSEWNSKENEINSKAKISFYSTEEGLYVKAKINDNEIFTDGESWEAGDMGQSKNNDDLRIFLTDSTADNRIPIFLSSDNLLRIYESGTSEYTANRNYIYKKYIESAKYKVVTTGEANVPNGSSSCTGMSMELFIPYYEVGISDASKLKILVGYSDISKKDEESIREETISYLGVSDSSNAEKNIENYKDLSSLI